MLLLLIVHSEPEKEEAENVPHVMILKISTTVRVTKMRPLIHIPVCNIAITGYFCT